MKYAGMPMGMWALFAGSFQKQLTAVLGYDAATAKQITKTAKPKYKEILAKLPEFEKGDRFQLNIIGCAMLGAFVLCMPKRPDTEALTVYYENAQMTPLMKWFCRKSGKSKFTAKDMAAMKATAALKAADRNPYSWNMDFYAYPDGSGYEGRFTKCGICTLMQVTGTFKNRAEFNDRVRRSIRSTDAAGVGTNNAVYLLMNQTDEENLPLLTRRLDERGLHVTAVPLDEQLRLISAAKQEASHA